MHFGTSLVRCSLAPPFLSTKRMSFSAVKLNLQQGQRQVFSDRGAESSDEGAKVRLSG